MSNPHPDHLWDLLDDTETTADLDAVEFGSTNLGRGPLSGGYNVRGSDLVKLVYETLFDAAEDTPAYHYHSSDDMELRVPRSPSPMIQAEGYSAGMTLYAYANGRIGRYYLDEAVTDLDSEVSVSVSSARWTPLEVFDLVLPHVEDGFPDDEDSLPRPVLDLLRDQHGHPKDAAHLERTTITLYIEADRPEWG